MNQKRHTKMRWVLVGWFLFSIWGLYNPLTQAQDDPTSPLSEEAQADLDRVLAALAKQQTYSSYVETYQEDRFLEISIVSVLVGTAEDPEDSNIDQTSTTQTRFERTAYVAHDEGNSNIQAEIKVEVEASLVSPLQDQTQTQTFAYEVEGEARIVDGNLYVVATYGDTAEEDIDALPPFPETWVNIAEFENWDDQFWDLQLEYYLFPESNPLLNPENDFTPFVQDVISAANTLDDGTLVTEITVILGGENIDGIISYLAHIPTSNQYFPAYFTENEIVRYAFSIGEDNTLYKVEARLQTANNVNLNQVDPRNISGVLAFARTDFTTTITYREINSPREPITNPLDE